MTKIITRENFVEMLEKADEQKRVRLIGRALVVLLQRQTYEEQRVEKTQEHNGIGFTGTDAEVGTNMAKWYQARGFLSQKQVAVWMKKNKTGVPRIAKYHGQLNESAEERLHGRQAVIE